LIDIEELSFFLPFIAQEVVAQLRKIMKA